MLKFDRRSNEDQAHWEGYIPSMHTRCEFAAGHEPHRGGWTLGYVYWNADGDECFVGLQETPVYATREEAMEEVRRRLSIPRDQVLT